MFDTILIHDFTINLFFNIKSKITIILKNNNTIFILSLHYKIELTLKNNKIISIKCNDNEVITKYDNLPFYQFMPKSIFHLVYIKNGLYKVIFFNNLSLNMSNNTLMNRLLINLHFKLLYSDFGDVELFGFSNKMLFAL